MKPPPRVVDRRLEDRKIPSLSPGQDNLVNKMELQLQQLLTILHWLDPKVKFDVKHKKPRIDSYIIFLFLILLSKRYQNLV